MLQNLCVDVAKGCALLMNSEHFKNIGMFDRKYFLFWEEVDLCRKFREKKLSVIINPKAIGIHKEGNSSKNDISTFITRIYHSELSPLIYFAVKKFTPSIYWKMTKYIFQGVGHLASAHTMHCDEVVGKRVLQAAGNRQFALFINAHPHQSLE